MPYVSIIVRSFNDIAYIEKTLSMIMNQRFNDFELINVDSGSKDGTFDVVKKYNPNAYQIKPGEYIPGKVLNDAIQKSSGEIIVFNNSDCIPQNEFWLENLIKPFKESDKIVATFGNQLPRKDARPLVIKDNTRAFGDGKISATWFHFFSLATSAAMKKTLVDFPFDPKIQYSEDIEWSFRMKNKGFLLRYVPDAIVEHSHNYTLKEVKKRFFNEGLADAKIFGTSKSATEFIVPCLKELMRDIAYLLCKGKVLYIPYGIIYRISQRYYIFKGNRSFFKKV